MLLASVKLLSFSFASSEFVAPTNTLGMCTREKCRLHANRATRLIVRLWLTCCPADEEILTKNLTGAIRFSRNVTEVPKAYNFITRWPQLRVAQRSTGEKSVKLCSSALPEYYRAKIARRSAQDSASGPLKDWHGGTMRGTWIV